jgi:hypothetical protein|tara:strand:+ start:811 stop:1056 length:246 start_codon:yes stop_codon:yes gene_type:complete
MTFNPSEIRLKAGTFNKDMQAPRTKKGKTTHGLKPGSINELKTHPTKTGMDHSLSKKHSNANFITDQDMGLKGGGKKSGAY